MTHPCVVAPRRPFTVEAHATLGCLVSPVCGLFPVSLPRARYNGEVNTYPLIVDRKGKHVWLADCDARFSSLSDLVEHYSQPRLDGAGDLPCALRLGAVPVRRTFVLRKSRRSGAMHVFDAATGEEVPALSEALLAEAQRELSFR